MDLDLEALWDVETAAKAAMVKPVTIRQWVYRGYLEAAEYVNGRPRYKPLDVARAERRTRERARRTVEVHRTAAA